MLPFTGFLIIAALVLTVVGFIMSIATDPKSAIVVVIALAGLVVLYFIGVSLADSEVIIAGRDMSKFNVDALISQRIGGVLNMTYYMFGIAIVAIVVDFIQRIVKTFG
ncbi:hypothetical protein KMW28_05850 [Flammeovirga yaeyamensis]|uniref:Integral membrane protein n=1 Tax=Flammeovirga yaeyamensis TaxID=367791 RepID=A0AAX1N6N5_9BACT|nr:hypothetical protein [Flammeovirga yaeyamensis]MBB3697690.1 hypothetical protein [Flammeovirga yaeyamensis]QWG03102.1 hypothetical protein KMW28_05850 [Flammeovirga yaeyamensis]